ncbi:hypothetical protein L0U85_15465 [Glycomyces sp. L485]|nr:hypothetical protein [Glycomyces sp. L485]MCH7232241.1 hypothetical protein [Glycomyces sp. L485]
MLPFGRAQRDRAATPNCTSQWLSAWNPPFMNVPLIMVPPLVMYVFF